MENYNLSVRNLTKSFKIGGMIFGTSIVAVDHVNLDIHSDKPWIIAIVGESGSGKSTLAKMVLKLLEAGSGDISLGGEDLSVYDKKKKEFRKMVQPISQNPYTAFNARRPVDSYLFETACNLGEMNQKRRLPKRFGKHWLKWGLTWNRYRENSPTSFPAESCRGSP